MRALGSTIARYSVANDATAEHPSKRCESSSEILVYVAVIAITRFRRTLD
jgi:hypothetical protein